MSKLCINSFSMAFFSSIWLSINDSSSELFTIFFQKQIALLDRKCNSPTWWFLKLFVLVLVSPGSFRLSKLFVFD